MRVFIGYGYNDDDKWIETHVFPLVEAFGCEVVHGKEVFGGPLSQEVVTLIHSSDALFGFTTLRRADGPSATHPWVIQELTTAYTRNPPVPHVEVRQEGVTSPGGMIEAANFQRIHYRTNDRAACLVQIAQALRRLQERLDVTAIRLGPEAVVQEIRPLLRDPSFVCRYRTLRNLDESALREASVFRIKGGLSLRLKGVKGALVEITISAGGKTWQSEYEAVDAVGIELKGQE